MVHRKIPDNDHDAIIQMWYALIGTNGTGVVKKLEEMEKVIPTLVTNDECKSHRDDKSHHANRVFGYIKDVALVVLAVLAVIKGVI